MIGVLNMPKTKAKVPEEILDRTTRTWTWEQLIAEAELAIRNSLERIAELRISISFFEDQKKRGIPCPKPSTHN
jgi:hypothetical protein